MPIRQLVSEAVASSEVIDAFASSGLPNPDRRNVSIDWTVKESTRAKLRVIVKRILRKHGHPPDKQESATDTVLAQAEELSDAWLASA